MLEFARRRENREDILGQFAEESDFDILIDEDCDFYMEDPFSPDRKDETNVIFKLRKNAMTKEEKELAYSGLRKAAAESQNRGMAGGPRGEVLIAKSRGGRDWVSTWQEDVIAHFMQPNRIDDALPTKRDESNEVRGRVWLRSKVDEELYGEYHGWFDRWVETMKKVDRSVQAQEAEKVAHMISDTNYAQTVMSGIAGYYDRYPRIPYGRACAFNDNHPKQFEQAFPFLRKLNDVFRKELPTRWAAQRACADKLDPKFLIDDTVFTTLTVNHNWRTAGHRDAGDLTSGFSNISGLGAGWKGYYFVLPEFKVGINLQPGDILLVNNHEGIHTNTAPEGDDNDRLTVVSYFREAMLQLKSWEYECLRKQFVEELRHTPTHKYWRDKWNGVYEGMWKSSEWAEYLTNHNMKDEDGIVGVENSLEAFF